MKNLEITQKESELLQYCLKYTMSNLDHEAFCLGGIDEATEEELQQAEKDIFNLIEKIKNY